MAEQATSEPHPGPAAARVGAPRRVAVVFNPASGDAGAAARQDATRRALAAAGVDVRWLQTTERDPGRGQARRAVEEGAEVVPADGATQDRRTT